jgi:hypothetical protein
MLSSSCARRRTTLAWVKFRSQLFTALSERAISFAQRDMAISRLVSGYDSDYCFFIGGCHAVGRHEFDFSE